MSNIMTEGHSLLRPPYFDGKNYTEWKERMRIFIRSVDIKLWFVIKNGREIPRQVQNEGAEKSEDEYNEEEIKILELDAKAINILCYAMSADAFEKYSSFRTAKQIWDELEREMTVVNSPTPQQVSNSSLTASDTHQFNSPDLCFLEDTREAMDNLLDLCVPLHKHALEGNWPAAEDILRRDDRLVHAAIASGWPTLLHVAAGANYPHFVKKLLDELDDQHIILQDIKGNTALCFAAASGNMQIAQSLVDRVPGLPTMRGGGGHTPLQFAVMQGKCEMARYLYDKTPQDNFQYNEWKLLFFTCINNGNYNMALKMAESTRQLAHERDLDDDTALHILAQVQIPLDSSCHCPEHQIPGKKQDEFLQLVNFLWARILRSINSEEEMRNIISNPFQLLFDAAIVGNFGFLSELINACPSLIWEVDNENKSIIHTAVSHRHASIFNLVHEIGFQKDIIVKYFVKDKITESNTLLHLAAKLAPPGRLELVSGAAFQMCLELLWFEEVKKIMPPSYIKLKNSDGLTAQELFTVEHKGLRKEAEDWIKRTAEFCMIISTVIATAVFSAAINIPGGIDDSTNKPNYLDKTWFLVFAISDATAFISSATATLIFLSILISRYAEDDFRKVLPMKLIIGLITLFISITFMMVAFGSSFFITYYYGLMWVPIFISVFAILPMLLYLGLQYSLWSDIIYSTIKCRKLFRPSNRMLYVRTLNV